MASDQMQKVATSVELLGQKQKGAQVTMLNQTPTSMKLFRSVTWAGSAAPGYPAGIQPGESVVFNNLANPCLGSKAAVFYATDCHLNPLAWVLAWDAPAH
ncbi:hypothetical protein RND81_02G119200 [Saponaria officinalis]